MKSYTRSLLFAAFSLLLFAGMAGAQNNRTSFTDANLEFTFEIPDERWKVVSRSPVSLVFTTANEGDLEIRKLTAPAATPLADLMRKEEDKLQILRGFVAGKDENFSGALRGAVYNYEFLRSGRNMAGRFYYLRSGDTVYVLRFTAYADKLRSLRTQTDLIARTFQIKKS
jgi:hypothetical protein